MQDLIKIENLNISHRSNELKDEIIKYAENNGVILAVCGGYQLLGKYYKLNSNTIEGIGLLDICTEQGEGRLTLVLVTAQPMRDYYNLANEKPWTV